MIQIVANLCWMVPGVVGGSEEYTTRLLRSVAANQPPDIEVQIAGLRSLSRAHPDLVTTFETSTLAIQGSRRALRLAAENSWLAARSRRADLVHHFGGHVPAVHPASVVVTVHDTQPLDMPNNFSGVKRAYMARMLPRSIAAAQVICTPSEWVGSRLVDHLGVDASKIKVVPSTWDDRTPAEPLTSAANQGMFPELIDREIVLYPAVTHPHKNHTVLLEAVARLSKSRPSLRLVLTGAPGRAQVDVAAAIARLGVGDVVVQLGRVSHEKYRALLELSHILAFPSVYEGFGLPVLEAMHWGKPVVAADATSLPEILGGSGILVDAHDGEAWAEAIESVLVGSSDTTRMVAAGKARSEAFRPRESARRLVDVWRDAAA